MSYLEFDFLYLVKKKFVKIPLGTSTDHRKHLAGITSNPCTKIWSYQSIWDQWKILIDGNFPEATKLKRDTFLKTTFEASVQFLSTIHVLYDVTMPESLFGVLSRAKSITRDRRFRFDAYLHQHFSLANLIQFSQNCPTLNSGIWHTVFQKKAYDSNHSF